MEILKKAKILSPRLFGVIGFIFPCLGLENSGRLSRKFPIGRPGGEVDYKNESKKWIDLRNSPNKILGWKIQKKIKAECFMKVLLAEDDKNTLFYLQKGLTENGFLVETAPDGETAIQFLSMATFDIIILDVMLPQKSGWEVLESIRKSGKTAPVLFLTAKDKVEDRLKGFELGADDYLVKPFSFSELLARMRAILRRASQIRSDSLKIADLEIDFIRHKAFREGKLLDLRPKEFSLLSLLARRMGETLSRTYIADQVWDMNFEGETNVVDVHIRRLRMTVDDPFSKKLIHTVRGVGYVLEDRN